MGKYVKVSKGFTDLVRELQDTDNIEKELAQDIKKWVSVANIPTVNLQQNGSQLSAVIKGATAYAKQQDGSFIDLKEAYARSPKAKHKENGGWYLIIPIGARSKDLRSIAPKSLWQQFSHADFGTTIEIPKLQQALGKDQSQVISNLQYQWKSNNVTRVAPKNGKGTRGKYITFRTVSDKSDPMSWIIGRQNFRKEDPELTDKMSDLLGEAVRVRMTSYDVSTLDLKF